MTLAGLLVVAHAAAATANEGWDDEEPRDNRDGVRLRHVANGLFRLGGVDWRGRPR